jgi:hypothetical protein
MRGTSPYHIAEIFKEPLADAALAVDMAQNRLERAQVAAAGEDVSHETEREAVMAAQLLFDSRREAGRAALSTITDFPPEDTLDAQMHMDRRPHEERTAVFGHIKALNEHAAADNPVVALIGGVTPDLGIANKRPAHFLELEPVYVGPAVRLVREEDGEHRLTVRTDSAQMLGLAPPLYTRYLVENHPETHTIRTPVDRLGFAADAETVDTLFDEAAPGSMPPVVAYGEEAVTAFAAAIAERTVDLKPLIYGITQNMDLPYEGSKMSRGERLRAQHEFCEDITNHYLSYTVHRAPSGWQYPFLTPEIQKFIGLPDQAVVRQVEETVRRRSSVAYSRRRATVFNPDVAGGPSRELRDMWVNLWNKGFTELAEQMLEPDTLEATGRKISRTVLSRELHMVPLSKHRRIRRALTELSQQQPDPSI